MNLFDFDFYEIVVWVATFIMCFINSICRQAPSRRPGGLGQPVPNPITVIMPIVFFVTFAGLRTTVGDTFYYEHSFVNMPDENAVTLDLFINSMYTFFQNIIRNLTDDPQYLIFFSAVFALPVPLIILYRYSCNYSMSLYLFVAYGYLGGMMNGMRQYMAAAIVLCATKYLFSLKKTDFFKYAIFVLLASCMHSSALIMLPIYFVVRRRAWQISSYIITIGSVVCVIFADALMPSFLRALEQTDYSSYSTNGWFTSGTEGGSSFFRVLVTLIPILIAYIGRDRMRRMGHAGDILINLAFLNTAIYMLAVYNWIFARLAIYLSIYYIILITWVLNVGVKPKDRAAYNTVCTLAFFIYSRLLSYQIASYISNYFFPGRKLF